MIPANKSLIFDSVLDIYNRWLFRRRFQDVHIKGLEQLTSGKGPLLLCANHSSWWDGLVAHLVSRVAGLDSFCMMEEKQLAKLRPFTWAGAFSVVRERPREALQSVIYAKRLLSTRPRCGLWVFPQGEILPNERRPLHFYRGIERMVPETGSVRIHPVAIRYEFRSFYKPEVFISIGHALPITSPQGLSDAASTAVETLLDGITADIESGRCEGYQSVLRRPA